MTPTVEQLQAKITDLETRLKKLEGFLLGSNDDVRFKANVRRAVVDSEHTTDKPTIVNKNGKKYNLQTV